MNYAGSALPRNVLQINLSLETNYDDNVLGNNQDRAGDVGFLFGPNISLRREGRQLSLALNYQLYFRLYRQITSRDAVDQSLGFDSNYQVNSRLAFRARASALYTKGIFQPHGGEEIVPGLGSPSSLNGTLFTPTARQLTYNTRLDATYQASLRDSFALFGGFSARNYNQQALDSGVLGDSQKTDFGLLYRHRLSPHDTLGVSYTLQDFRFGPNTHDLVHGAFFSFAKQISPSVTVDVFGGPEYSRLHDLVLLQLGFLTLQIPIFRTQWNWAIGGDVMKRTQRTAFQVAAQRQVSDGGGLIGAVVSTYVGGSARRRLPGRWDAVWSAGYAKNSSLQSTFVQRSFQTVNADFGLERALTERLSLRVGYDFIRQRSSEDSPTLANFDRDLWYVRLLYRFRQIPLGR